MREKGWLLIGGLVMVLGPMGGCGTGASEGDTGVDAAKLEAGDVGGSDDASHDAHASDLSSNPAFDATPDAAQDLSDGDVWAGPDVELNTARLVVRDAAPGFEAGDEISLQTLGAQIEERITVAYTHSMEGRSIDLKLENLNLNPGYYGCVLDASPPVEEITVTLRSSDGTNTQRYVALDGVGSCAFHYVQVDEEEFAGELAATLIDDVAGIESIEISLGFRFVRE